MISRTLLPHVRGILEKYGKMAFVSGPRQVGKTTLAREIQKGHRQSTYLNWDILTHQRRLVKDPYFFEHENRDPDLPFLVVFDDIHKYARWKSYLKGCFDGFHEEFQFLVTGSGRLDLFKKGGESLLGRYVALPLFPFTLGELLGRWTSWTAFKEGLSQAPSASVRARHAYDSLFRLTGFPEPFSRGELDFYNIWYQERRKILVHEDIRDASRIRDISLLDVLIHLLPERVASPLSLNALREDAGLAFETVRDWLLLLEAFYYLFRIKPYSRRLNRAIRKEAKAYLFDWGELENLGARFENLVALHLLKAVQGWTSTGGGEIGLSYVRDKEKREVDFLLTERTRPVCLVEARFSDSTVSPSLGYFQEKLGVPVAVQLLHEEGICKKIKTRTGIIWVISADRWLGLLP